MGTQEGNRGGKGGGPVLTSLRLSNGGLRNFSAEIGGHFWMNTSSIAHALA